MASTFLTQIVGPRNDRATSLRYAERFCELPFNKLDPGFSLKLRQLLGFLNQRLLLRWAWTTDIVNKHIQTSRGQRLQRCTY